MQNSQVQVTDNAFKRVAQLITKKRKKNLALRVSVSGGGCSGFIYNYKLISKTLISVEDLIIEKDNIQVIIDPLSQKFMKGCIIDFMEELGASYFEIRNPNVKLRCGCGNSFAI